jgi:hypothetical protein
MIDPTQPLWLPKGSVRAILALLVVVPAAIIALSSGITFTSDQIIGLVSLILTAYFVQKSSQNNGISSDLLPTEPNAAVPVWKNEVPYDPSQLPVTLTARIEPADAVLDEQGPIVLDEQAPSVFEKEGPLA